MTLQLIKDTWSIAKHYFINSKKNLRALAYFFAILFIIILMVATNFILSLSFSAFWTSLAILNYQAFIMSLVFTSCFILTLTGLSLLRNFFTELLITNWREFLTIDLINKYLNPEKQAYLNFSRHQQIDNIGQNIQWDVQKFTATTLNLCFDFFGSILSIMIFLYSLWSISGALSFTLFGLHFSIHGYLVLASFFIGLTANIVSHQIGKLISSMIKSRLDKEGELRTEIEKIHDDAEFIAQAKSSDYHQTKLEKIFTSIQIFSFSILYEKIKLNSFQFFFAKFSKLLPYIIASPLYFIKKISLNQLNQSAYAFSKLSRSIAWFNNAYEDFAILKATSERLAKLYQHLDILPAHKISIHKVDANQIDFELDEIFTPSHQLLLKNLNLHFKPKENVLIKGASGLGKSTLFKTLAENWHYGIGKITLPNEHTPMFLPQRPSIPNDSFRAVLSYPDDAEIYSDETYTSILTAVGLASFIPRLYQEQEWAKILSGGQQQRILFARALLKKPTWLFMDESSSSLDPESEAVLYATLKQTLVDTTIISIAHRDTVAAFHDKIITLIIDGNSKEITLQETLNLVPPLQDNLVTTTCCC